MRAEAEAEELRGETLRLGFTRDSLIKRVRGTCVGVGVYVRACVRACVRHPVRSTRSAAAVRFGWLMV